MSKVNQRSEVASWVVHGLALYQVSVLGGDGKITVHDASLIGIDSSHDLAVLKVDILFSKTIQPKNLTFLLIVL